MVNQPSWWCIKKSNQKIFRNSKLYQDKKNRMQASSVEIIDCGIREPEYPCLFCIINIIILPASEQIRSLMYKHSHPYAAREQFYIFPAKMYMSVQEKVNSPNLYVDSMSQFQLPKTWRGGAELRRLTVEDHGDRVSTYWLSDIPCEGFQRVCLDFVPPTSDVLIQGRTSSLETNLKNVGDKVVEEPLFFVVYGSDYSLSWELADSDEFQSEIGVASEELMPELVEKLYDSTSIHEFSSEDVPDIAQILIENVDG
jgi:hypothetical protein